MSESSRADVRSIQTEMGGISLAAERCARKAENIGAKELAGLCSRVAKEADTTIFHISNKLNKVAG